MSTTVFSNIADKAKTTQAINTNPVELIQSAIIKLNQLTVAVTYSPKTASMLVDKEITPLFDFNYIANQVLWVLNADLSQAEIQHFSDRLKDNIASILLVKLSQVNPTSLNFVSARSIIGNSIAVKLRVNSYSQFGFYIDLLFHQNERKQWQIFDIILNNDSLINYYQKRVLIQARRYGIYKVLGKI